MLFLYKTKRCDHVGFQAYLAYSSLPLCVLHILHCLDGKVINNHILQYTELCQWYMCEMRFAWEASSNENSCETVPQSNGHGQNSNDDKLLWTLTIDKLF